MIDWIITHRKTVLNYSVATFAVIFSAYTFYSKFGPHPEKDYLAADAYFQKWAGGDHSDRETLQKLDKLITSHPELHAKYDALIAERLLMWNEPKAATNYLQTALKRIEGSSIYYPQFARTSLLISQGELKDALEDAMQLKEEMTEDPSLFAENERVRWEGLLYAFNLVRIATLEQRAGTPQGERKAWEELMALRDKDAEAFSMIQYHFRENDLTLFDYIAHRTASL